MKKIFVYLLGFLLLAPTLSMGMIYKGEVVVAGGSTQLLSSSATTVGPWTAYGGQIIGIFATSTEAVNAVSIIANSWGPASQCIGGVALQTGGGSTPPPSGWGAGWACAVATSNCYSPGTVCAIWPESSTYLITSPNGIIETLSYGFPFWGF